MAVQFMAAGQFRQRVWTKPHFFFPPKNKKKKKIKKHLSKVTPPPPPEKIREKPKMRQ